MWQKILSDPFPSFLEIYNEIVRDLLVPDSDSSRLLDVREDTEKQGELFLLIDVCFI
jgi:hypothetical protein